MFSLTRILYYLIPAAALVFFIGSLTAYLSARHKNKRSPGTYSERQMTVRLLCLIVSAVIAAVMMLVVIVIVGLVYMVLAYM